MTGWIAPPRGMRPCGVCRAYVIEVTGCKHWRPNAMSRSEYDRNRKAGMTPEQREHQCELNRIDSQRRRDRAKQAQAKQNASTAVAAFQQGMGKSYR